MFRWPAEERGGYGAYPTTYSVSVRVSSRGQSRGGMNLTTHLNLKPRLRMSGAIRHLLLYTFVVWTRTTLNLHKYVIYLRLNFVKLRDIIELGNSVYEGFCRLERVAMLFGRSLLDILEEVVVFAFKITGFTSTSVCFYGNKGRRLIP